MYQHSLYPHKRRGISTIEYGILAALISVVAIGAVTALGSNSATLMCNIDYNIMDANYGKGNVIGPTSVDQCAAKAWLNARNLNTNNTDEQAFAQCNQSPECLYHFDQIKYNGNPNAYLTAMNVDTSNRITSADSPEAQEQKTQNAASIGEEACNSIYSNANADFLAACSVDVQNALTNTTWEPGIIVGSPQI